MNEENFEGTLILEKMAELSKLEDFFDAIDSDDFVKVKKLLKLAQIDDSTIEVLMSKIKN